MKQIKSKEGRGIQVIPPPFFTIPYLQIISSKANSLTHFCDLSHHSPTSSSFHRQQIQLQIQLQIQSISMPNCELQQGLSCNSSSDSEESEEKEAEIGFRRREWRFWGRVLNPRSAWVQEWNRLFLLVCAVGLFVDPLFFYTLSISEGCMCLFVDGWFAVTVTVLRCMIDSLHLWNVWLQFKMNRRMHHDGRSVALRYFKSRRGFSFDLFVILPLPQVTNPFLNSSINFC